MNFYFIITIIIFIFSGCSILPLEKINPNISKEIVTSFYETGKIEFESVYLNGKLHGVSNHWSESGALLNKVEYKFGKVHGLWINYYPNGNVKQKTEFEYGKKNGEEKWFYENSQLQSVIKYENDSQISQIVRYDRKGNLIY